MLLYILNLYADFITIIVPLIKGGNLLHCCHSKQPAWLNEMLSFKQRLNNNMVKFAHPLFL